MTRSYAILEVDVRFFEAVKKKMIDAGYGHAIIRSKDGMVIDMHGIALKGIEAPKPLEGWAECHDHNCPDNAPFEGDRVPENMIHCHQI